MQLFSPFPSAMICALGLCLTGSGWGAGPARDTGCLVAEFKTLALGQHDVQLRMLQARDWLQKNVSRCSSEQLSAIKSSSPSWLGHALTPQLEGLIEGAVEARISGNSVLMGRLYESLAKEEGASEITYRTSTPRPPVVRPADIRGVLAGHIHHGQTSGPPASVIHQNINQNIGQAVEQPRDLADRMPSR